MLSDVDEIDVEMEVDEIDVEIEVDEIEVEKEVDEMFEFVELKTDVI